MQLRAEVDVLRAEADDVMGGMWEEAGPCNAAANMAIDTRHGGIRPAVFEEGSDAALAGAGAICAAEFLAEKKVKASGSALHAAAESAEIAGVPPITKFCVTIGAVGGEMTPLEAAFAYPEVAT